MKIWDSNLPRTRTVLTLPFAKEEMDGTMDKGSVNVWIKVAVAIHLADIIALTQILGRDVQSKMVSHQVITQEFVPARRSMHQNQVMYC